MGAIKNVDKKNEKPKDNVINQVSSNKSAKGAFKRISSDELLRRRVNVYPYLM